MRWRPGDQWAIVEGAAAEVAGAFDLPVRDYQGRKGQVFYASPQQPDMPEALQGEVTALGRILGYSPHHVATPGMLPLDVLKQGLTPEALLTPAPSSCSASPPAIAPRSRSPRN